MNLRLPALIALTLANFGCSISETETKSIAVVVATSLNGTPLIYLQKELPLESLEGSSLSTIQGAFDPRKISTNEKNLKKDSKRYYLVYPNKRYIMIELEDQTIESAADHGENASSLLMKAIMKELNDNRQAVEATGAIAPVSSP